MKERIREIMGTTALSQQDFAARLGVSPATLSSILNGRTGASNKIVQAIHHAFPEVNINWLIFGEGSMVSDGAESDEVGNMNAEETALGGYSESGSASPGDGGYLVAGESLHVTPADSYLPAGGGDLFNSSIAEDSRKAVAPQHQAASLQRTTTSPRTPQGVQRGVLQHVLGTGREEIQKIANNVDMLKREIREIRVFFSDGTYETFGPSGESAYQGKK